MKLHPLLFPLIAATVLLTSCGSPDVYVTTASGAPITGVEVKPVAISYGCPRPVYTGPCGGASVPCDMRTEGRVNLVKQDYETVYGVDLTQPGPLHIVMKRKCD